MSDMLKIHSCDQYPLSVTKDDSMGSVESLGTKEVTLSCRWVPVAAGDRTVYEITQEVEAYKVCFVGNPGLDRTKALVWDDKVWRVRRVIDSSGGLSRLWQAIVEHMPKMEIAAP